MCRPLIRQDRLQVSSDLREIDTVLSWFEKLYQTSIPMVFWRECLLALSEGFTNAARHAHNGLPLETPIDIEVKIYPDQAEIRIWDYGPGFDLTEWLRQHPQLIDLESCGGRGLRIMYAIANHMTYTTKSKSNHRNCLLICKNLENHSQN